MKTKISKANQFKKKKYLERKRSRTCFEILPVECKIKIFEYLDRDSLFNFYQTNKSNNKIITKYIPASHKQQVIICYCSRYLGNYYYNRYCHCKQKLKNEFLESHWFILKKAKNITIIDQQSYDSYMMMTKLNLDFPELDSLPGLFISSASLSDFYFKPKKEYLPKKEKDKKQKKNITNEPIKQKFFSNKNYKQKFK